MMPAVSSQTASRKLAMTGTADVKPSDLPYLRHQAAHPSLALSDVTNATRRILSSSPGIRDPLPVKERLPTYGPTISLAQTKLGPSGIPSRHPRPFKPVFPSAMAPITATIARSKSLRRSVRRTPASPRKGVKPTPSLFKPVTASPEPTPSPKRRRPSSVYQSRLPIAVAMPPNSSLSSMHSHAYASSPPSYRSPPPGKKRMIPRTALLQAFSTSSSDKLLEIQPPFYGHGDRDGQVYIAHEGEDKPNEATMLQINIGGIEMVFHTCSPLDPTIVKLELMSKGVIEPVFPPSSPHIIVTRDTPSRFTPSATLISSSSAVIEEWPSFSTIPCLPMQFFTVMDSIQLEQGQRDWTVPRVPAALRPFRRATGNRNKAPDGNALSVKRTILRKLSADAIAQPSPFFRSAFHKARPSTQPASSTERISPSLSSSDRLTSASPRTNFARTAMLRSSQGIKARRTSSPVSTSSLPVPNLTSPGNKRTSFQLVRRLSGKKNGRAVIVQPEESKERERQVSSILRIMSMRNLVKSKKE